MVFLKSGQNPLFRFYVFSEDAGITDSGETECNIRRPNGKEKNWRNRRGNAAGIPG